MTPLAFSELGASNMPAAPSAPSAPSDSHQKGGRRTAKRSGKKQAGCTGGKRLRKSSRKQRKSKKFFGLF
jgi:hypothetical protein